MDSVAEGHYFKLTIGSTSRVVAWSHRSRFEKALSLSGQNNKKLLDYGCGDGTFLALASDRFIEGHGVDIDADQIEDCRNRLASYGNVSFFVVGDLAGTEHNQTYDVVTCMETLEHCTEPAAEKVLADVARLCAADGRVIISVPVEVGPSFLVKRIARRQAVSRDTARETYPLRDALKMLFAGKRTCVARPVYGEPFVGHSITDSTGADYANGCATTSSSTTPSSRRSDSSAAGSAARCTSCAEPAFDHRPLESRGWAIQTTSSPSESRSCCIGTRPGCG